LQVNTRVRAPFSVDRTDVFHRLPRSPIFDRDRLALVKPGPQ
jgi:hypothetical protein